MHFYSIDKTKMIYFYSMNKTICAFCIKKTTPNIGAVFALIV